jgi:hypothetical protein
MPILKGFHFTDEIEQRKRMDKVNLELFKITRAEDELRDGIYKEKDNSLKAMLRIRTKSSPFAEYRTSY